MAFGTIAIPPDTTTPTGLCTGCGSRTWHGAKSCCKGFPIIKGGK